MRLMLMVAAVTLGALTAAAPAGAFQYVYAGGLATGDLGFGARVNGGLTESSHSPFATGAGSLEGLALSPDGRNVFAADRDGGALYAFGTDARARLVPSTGSPQPTGTYPYGVAPSVDGKFVYATASLPSAVFGFKVAKDGTIAPTSQGAVTIPAPTGLAVTPNGKYLYAATETSGGAVYGYRIAKNGALSELPSSPTAGPGGAFAIAIAPNGKALYAGNRDDGTVNAFAIEKSGALDELSGSPYPAGGGNPFSITVSPNGRNVYVGLYDDSKLGVFDVGRHGTLTPQPLSPYDAAASVTALTLDPAGRYLYEQSPTAEIDVLELDSNGTPADPTGFTFESHGDFQSIVTAPDQPPKAKFEASKAVAGSQVHFNAKESRSKNGIEYFWKFGDGSKDDTFRDKVKHAYRKPGRYEVKLTLMTQDGCSTKYVSAGQTPYCNGGKQAVAKRTIRVRK